MNEPIETPASIDELTRGWEARDPDGWAARPDRYLVYGRQAVALGRPALAVDVLNEGLARFPDEPDLAYFACLALANCGSLSEAQSRIADLLDRVPDGSPLLSEALSLAGRIAKERWSKLPDADEGRQALGTAASFYGRAYDLAGEAFPGINAATMNVLNGRADEGRRIAREVKQRCLAAAAERDDHWLAATLGEACLLLGEPPESDRGKVCRLG